MLKRVIELLIIALIVSAATSITIAKEYYFKFAIDSKESLGKLTRIVSIDNVKGDTVYAYANDSEFADFKSLGYQYEILPAPSSLYNPPMTSDKDIVLDWDYYPTYTAYVELMNDFATDYPNLCQVENIGSTAEGRELLFAKISANVTVEENEPELMYSSSMHGDETTGYVLMLHLIEYLLSNYGTDSQVTNLLDNSEIWINPLANPDGTYNGGNNTVWGATRYNANDVDINRNFPDPEDGAHPDGEEYQPETLAMIDLFAAHNFVLSANFHGGAEVVNYPWDTWETRHADDAWFIAISRQYADSAQANSPSGYMTDLDNGITNGYDWYEVAGGRQDCMNYFYGGREVTIEISTTKTLPVSQLLDFWDYNRAAFLTYLERALYGVHGVVTNATTGEPVAAMITTLNHDTDSSQVFSDPDNGDYYRMLSSGTYSLYYSALGYIPQTVSNITVTDWAVTTVDVQLEPLSNDPILAFYSQNSGVVNAGDSVQMAITLVNNGGGDANGVTGLLSTTDNYITISQASSSFPTIESLGGTAISNLNYAFYVSPLCPSSHEAQFKLNVTDNSGYVDSVYFTIAIGLQIENFETGDFASYDWQMGGNADWIITTSDVYEGSYSAKSGSISHNQTTYISLDYEATNQDSISFYHKASSESGYDYLKFYIDNSLIAQWSGESDWARSAYTVSAGSHNFKWLYSKDGSEDDGDDCAWIDYIIFPMTTPALQIVTQSLPDCTVGIAYSQQLEASGGSGDLSWSDAGDDLADYSLTLSSAGLVSGTPTLSGLVEFTALVQDENGSSTDFDYSFTLNSAVQITTDSLPVAVIQEPYSYQLEASGGTGELIWADRDNNLHGTGLTLSADGIISGTPVSAVTITIVAVATDELGSTDEQWLTVYFEASFIPGDANGDGRVIGSDVTYLVNYFRGIQPAPTPLLAGDANGDCSVIGSDVTYLVTYFRGIGQPPVMGDCARWRSKVQQ